MSTLATTGAATSAPIANGPCPIRRVLGIESSCDETAASVVDDGTTIISSVVSSQIDLHARYGGVVPELASRAHVELLTPVLADALEQAGSDHTGRGIDGIAVTHGPGLIGSLLVGVAEAKALLPRVQAWLVEIRELQKAQERAGERNAELFAEGRELGVVERVRA